MSDRTSPGDDGTPGGEASEVGQTSRPRLRAPEGACDCHMHIFDPRFPPREGSPYTPPTASVADYREMQERLGLGRVVVIQSVTHGTDNANLLAALDGFGEIARGVAVIDADVGEGVLADMTAKGVRGVRFELANGVLSIDDLDAVAAKIAPFGWHIDLQTDGRELPDLVDRLSGLPCPLVMDHYGKFIDVLPIDHPAVRSALRLLGEGNTWIKLTAPYAGHHRPAPWPELIPLAKAFIATARERLVWGSEWPQSMMPMMGKPIPDHAGLLDLLLDYTDDEAAIRDILVRNPAELYGFPSG